MLRYVSGTARVNGLPVAGVAFAASGGGSCSPSNSAGQYSCAVLDGWTGSVTPSHMGYSFTPSSRSYTSLAADDPAEDYAATPSSPASNIAFVHVDHLNTPRLLTNDQGQTVWRWDQAEPFGVNVADENPSGLGAYEMPMRFPGQYFDKETNLHYNYFRDYDSVIGRYAEADPIGLLGGINPYAYVRGSPIMLVDPRGLQAVEIEGRNMLPGEKQFPRARLVGPVPCAKAVANTWWATAAQQGWVRNDKRLHCVIVCDIKRKCGLDTAIAAGEGRELYQLYVKREYWDPAKRYDSGLDQIANRYGLTCPPDVDCYQHCIAKY